MGFDLAPRKVVVGEYGWVALSVGRYHEATIALTGKDRVTQHWPLSAGGPWKVGLPPKMGPYERMTLVRLCVALEKLGGRPTEHALGPEFEEDLEAIRGQPWPGAIAELGLIL
jgi:hypothetical protein